MTENKIGDEEAEIMSKIYSEREQLESYYEEKYEKKYERKLEQELARKLEQEHADTVIRLHSMGMSFEDIAIAVNEPLEFVEGVIQQFNGKSESPSVQDMHLK